MNEYYQMTENDRRVVKYSNIFSKWFINSAIGVFAGAVFNISSLFTGYWVLEWIGITLTFGFFPSFLVLLIVSLIFDHLEKNILRKSIAHDIRYRAYINQQVRKVRPKKRKRKINYFDEDLFKI